MSLPQKQNLPSHNMPQPQINNSQQRMRKLRSRKTYFQIRDQDTPNLGLLPANLPNTPLTTRANDTTESSVSIGVTVGCTLLLIMIVSLLTILFCIWHRKKSLRSKALDCTKSPWTQRYRDGARNGGLARPEMRTTRTIDSQTDVKQTQEHYHDQRGNTYTIYKDTPSLETEGNDTFSKESDLDPSFQNEYRLARQVKLKMKHQRYSTHQLQKDVQNYQTYGVRLSYQCQILFACHQEFELQFFRVHMGIQM